MKITNHKNSALARFHEEMAGRKRWTLDQLAEAMQVSALQAQMSSGKEHSVRVGDDYVKAILYGRRPMPKGWEVAAANVLELDLTDYRTQKAAALAQKEVSFIAGNTFPIDYWPHFAWRSDATPLRKIAALLYGCSKASLTPLFSVIPGNWQPPGGFSSYTELKAEAWRELVTDYSRMRKEPPNPRNAWHVRRIKRADDNSVAMEILQADYRDIMVTATRQGLEHMIRLGSGATCTVRQWLAASWIPGDFLQPVLPGSRHLVVNLMVLTKDGKAVLSRQGSDSPESAGSWATSVSTVVNPKNDCDSTDMPVLARAASRGCKEELNLETDGTSISWITMSAGLKFGSHTFFGVVESSWSSREIEAAVARNVERANRDRTHVCQVVEVEFLDVSAEAVAQRLRTHNYRPYLELGLALLLWRRGQADIIQGIQKPFSVET